MTSLGTHGQNLAHDIGRRSADALAEAVEGLEVGLVECVADDFDVHLIQILLRDTVDEERRCGDEMGVNLGGGEDVPVRDSFGH